MKQLQTSLFGLVLAMAVSRAAAQEGVCQLVDSITGPARQTLICPSGPKIEAESKADLRVQDLAGKGRPASATISSGAALFDIPTGYPGGFEIRTPRAIASVRGTEWIVDVEPARTSVFVLRGEVDVRRTGEEQAVALHEGDGIDVVEEARPMEPTRWTPERAAALLARFGR